MSESAFILYAIYRLDQDAHQGLGEGVLAPLERKSKSGLFVLYEKGERTQIESLFGAEHLSDMTVLEKLVLHQQSLFGELWQKGSAIPFRFGTVMPSLAPVLDAIDTHKDAIHAKLDALAGHQEIGFQIILDAQNAEEQEADRKLEARGEGRNYLRAMQAQKTEKQDRQERRDALVDQMLEIAEDFASDALDLAHGRSTEDGGSLARNVSLLLPDEDIDAFVAAAQAWVAPAKQVGLSLRVIGPMPPQSFAHLDLLSHADNTDSGDQE